MMSGINKKLQGILKGKRYNLKIQFEDTKQGSKPDSHMTGIWESSDQEFEAAKINILRTLMNKVDIT